MPKGLAGTVQPFSFNRLDRLKALPQSRLTAVKMEVQRSLRHNLDSSRARIVRAAESFSFSMNAPQVFVRLLAGSTSNMVSSRIWPCLVKPWAMASHHCTIGSRSVMEAAQSVHQQHLLDGAHWAHCCPENPRGDGAGAQLGAGHCHGL